MHLETAKYDKKHPLESFIFAIICNSGKRFIGCKVLLPHLCQITVCEKDLWRPFQKQLNSLIVFSLSSQITTKPHAAL